MAYELEINAMNNLSQGTVIYEKGQKIQCVALVMKGRVEAKSEGARMILSSGNFLGMDDIKKGTFSFTYTVSEDAVLFAVPINSTKHVSLLLDEKPQYRGLLITSLNFYISDLKKIYDKLGVEVRKLHEFVLGLYNRFRIISERCGMKPQSLPSIERLSMQVIEDFTLPEETEYYIESSKIPVEAQKNYFSANVFVSKHQYSGQCEVVEILKKGCMHYSDWMARLFRIMAGDENNLFSLLGKTALNVKKASGNFSDISDLLDELLENINTCEDTISKLTGNELGLDREYMEKIYLALLSEDDSQLSEYENDDIVKLHGSLHQILEYGMIDSETSEKFESAINEFLAVTDKFSRDREVAEIRKKITASFFDIYESVVKRSFKDQNQPLAVKLFLRYGFVSEELLSGDEIRELVAIPDIDNENFDCNVYTLPEWLNLIYTGKKNPSKDEFDTDFELQVRKDVMEKKITQKEAAVLLKKGDARLHHEIHKFFAYSDRLVNGNVTSFVPVLCSEAIFTKITTSAINSAGINAEVHKIENVDYSIFYRESRDNYDKVGIPNFVNLKRYTPDFILFPVYGKRPLMWQDIEGRKRSTHARIVFPALSEVSVEQEMIKMMAYFRWDKCRTDMGANWNNFRYPSLTSEYTDYLQFYKKNSELSPDKREKVKAQLMQCNNKHRDVFTKDYIDYIQKESAGAMKLNKVSRDILFTYCPLASSYMEALMGQTIYQEAARRHNMEKKKLEKNIATTVNRFEKSGVKLPKEIKETARLISI